MKRALALLFSVLLVALCAVPVMASEQVTPSPVTSVCTTCPIDLEWAVGSTLGVQPTSGFTSGALTVDWILGEEHYIWLALNCTEVAGLDDLYIVFETGADVLEVTRTEPPVGWGAEVPYYSDFGTGAYIYGPAGGFYLAYGIAYAEFAVASTELGCYDLKAYLIKDSSGGGV